MTRIHDPHAIDGKIVAPDEVHDIIVVGAGPAGLAAALEAAKAGRQVLLVDEHPVAAALAGSDVPLWFGGRATPALQSPERLIETLVETEPMIAEAFEAGIDVRLGVTAWGLWRNRDGSGALPQAMLGLSDGQRSWTAGYGTLVLATGARDCALHFAGWDQPGVMGALAFHTLVSRYDAFAGRRVVILGSGDLALETALLAHQRGIAVAALIEVRDTVQGAATLPGDLAVLTGHRLLRAEGGIDGVEQIFVAGPDGVETAIACDTVILAIDAVPAIELAEVGGSTVVTEPLRGGAVTPGGAGEVLPGVWLAGAATGLTGPRELAEAQGRAVIALALGLDSAIAPLDLGFDRMAYRADWLRALMATSPDSTMVCQCEEVSRADLIGVQPPGYLPRPEKLACRSLGTLLEDGPPDAEQVKRLTRAGMGLCQGRRCREQVSLLLAMAANLPPRAAPRGNWRVPVRPVPLGVMADWDHAAAMDEGWDVWFGIDTQWIPYRDIGTPEEARHMAELGGNMHL
jgi:thioredoxin reductase